MVKNGETERTLPLRNLYKGYKQLDKQPEEWIAEISFSLPSEEHYIHFEKVSKRTHLDIASVNTAMCLYIKNGVIQEAGLSAGGVGPVPLFLQKASAFLEGKEVSEKLVAQVTEIIQSEISPITDARGSAAYKRLLLSQLVKAHFISMFPALQVSELVGS